MLRNRKYCNHIKAAILKAHFARRIYHAFIEYLIDPSRKMRPQDDSYTRRLKMTNGFTLLEVLIALVILAIAFSTSFLSLTSATQHLITLQDKTAAQWVGVNVIGQAQIGLISATGGSGTQKMFATNWNWNLSAYPTESPFVSRIVATVRKTPTSGSIAVVTGYVLRQAAQ